MKQILAIIKFTLKQNLSSKIFKGFLFLGILMIIAISVLKNLALYSQGEVISSTGQFFIEIFVLFVAIFVSSSQYFKDKKGKAIYLTITKPISRSQYILGKTLGIIMMVFVDLLIMGTFLTVVLVFEGYRFNLAYFYSYILMFYQLSIVVAIGIFFSVITDSAINANIFTICVYLIAHAVYEIQVVANKVNSLILKIILNFLYIILPNFTTLNYRDALKPVNNNLHFLFLSTIYTIGYLIVITALTSLIFSKKEL